ncbi:MAG: hypothetical protein OXC95_08020 [Dehalococcoidia bacterium]|nr:hypothetical protein [Dehalococcoidia bacterium]
MVELIAEFYRSVEPLEARQLNRGQICWGPVLYMSTQIQSVALASYDPEDERRNRYAILPSEPDDEALFNHMPVHELRLQNDEELLVNRAKRRPVIVVSQKNQDWNMGGTRLSERGLVCVPMYSFQDSDSSEFRSRIKAQEYPWWIYLPEGRGMREGFARLDRLQVIEESHLQPRFSALTDDALWFVSEWLRYYMTNEIDPLFWDARQESIQSLLQ